MFCPNCGKPVAEGQKFCAECGSPTAGRQYSAPSAAEAPRPVFSGPPAGSGNVRYGIPAPGFSDRVNDPEILAAVKKSKKSGAVWGLAFSALPFAGFVAYAAFFGGMSMMEAMILGGGVSLIFFVFQIVSWLRGRDSNSYEAVVVDKNWRWRSSGSDNSADETEYVVTVRTTKGKTKRIVERGNTVAYSLLDVGDRFRYHAGFAYPYELWDKRKGDGLHCVACGKVNSLNSDRCERCGVPLLK